MNKTEHPIIFSGSSVRAIIEGRKTMTRQVCKIQPRPWAKLLGHFLPGESIEQIFDGLRITWQDGTNIKCPYGQSGDRLWVRETWREVDGHICYAATPETNYLGWDGWRWRPSIHMPRRYSRLTLEITGVKVERVQDINEENAIAEGIEQDKHHGYWLPGYNTTPVFAFRELWDSINAKRPGCAWSDNPWVWVIEFRRIN